MPEDEAWSSLRFCQQPLPAAAGNARTPRQPEGVTRAPVLGGRDFGAAAVTEWRCCASSSGAYTSLDKG